MDMDNYFEPQMEKGALQEISTLGLAHIGDAVYEILVRTWLCVHGKATGKGLHRATVALAGNIRRPRRWRRFLVISIFPAGGSGSTSCLAA